MIRVREAIAAVEQGRISAPGGALRHAPHTVAGLTASHWNCAYVREQGCFPSAGRRTDRCCSPVGRLDHSYGDGSLVCSCPPIEDFAQAAE